MFYIKLYRALIVTFTNALLIVLFTTQCIAGQTIEPVLRGKDPLPDALKGPGIESLDALGDTPANEKMKSESEIQGMFLQALGMDDAVQAISLGADKTLTDPYGKTAKEIAYESGSRHIYQQLQ